MRGGGPRGIVVNKVKPKNTVRTVVRIWSYLRVYRAGLFGVLIFTIFGTVCSLIAPYLLGVAVDDYILAGDYAGLVRLGMFLLAVYALQSLATWLQQFIMVKVSLHTVREMRRDIFTRLQLLPLRFFDRNTHGELMSRMTNDIENVSGTLNQSVTQLISSVLALIGSVGVMLYLNVWLTLVSMLMIPLVMYGTKFVAQWTRRYFSEQQKKLGELNGFIEETISGQKVIQVYRREKVAIEKFGEMNRNLTDVSIRAQIYSGVVAPLMNMFNNFSFAIMAAVGGWMAYQGWASVGIVVAFLNYSRQFQRPLNDLANQFNLVQSAIAGAERVFETIDTETEYESEYRPKADEDSANARGTEKTDGTVNVRGTKTTGGTADVRGSKTAGGMTDVPGRKIAEGATGARESKEDDGKADMPTAKTSDDSSDAFATKKTSASVSAGGLKGAGRSADRSEKAGGSVNAEALSGSDAPAFRPAGTGTPNVLRRIRGEVVFEDVSFSYEPGVPILRHVSLRAEPGQMIALVGPTGAGKTTIINLLTRFYEVDEGRITIDGVDIRDMDKNSLRSQIGLVLQDAYLFSDTIRENIRYGRLDATDEEIEEAAKLANAHRFIRQLPNGYDTMLAPGGSNLSQGQRQLLTIARAVLANPAILILDEATSSIDTRTEQHIQEALLHLMRGRTSFIIAHRLNTIRDADEIMVIDQGRIVEKGSHDELFSRQGRYYRMFVQQFKNLEGA